MTTLVISKLVRCICVPVEDKDQMRKKMLQNSPIIYSKLEEAVLQQTVPSFPTALILNELLNNESATFN